MLKILLVVVLLIVAYYITYNGYIEGGKDVETVVIMVLKAPLGVQEMRKKYIKTDTQPPHITLGHLSPGFDEDLVLKHLRYIKPNPIEFQDWRHTKTFIGLIPQNMEEIDRIVGPMHKFLEPPKEGYHMSIAYRPQRASLDEYTHKKVHEAIHTPIICPVKEIRIARRQHGGEWVKYKTIQY
jgi:hypothetical protein